MKKIISLVLTLMLICTLCTPVFAAESFYIDIRKSKVIPQGTYSSLYIDDSAKGTIENGKTVTMENATLTIKGTLDIEGRLEGTVEGVPSSNSPIILGENGYFKLIFTGTATGEYSASNFVSQLSNSGIAYEKSTDDSGNIVISYHKHELITKTVTTCTGCDYYEETVNQPTATGSIISQGYPEIIYAIGGIAIGVVATLLISRKKKATVSSTSAGDKE